MKSPIEKLYEKYEYLAHIYSKKIFNFHRYSYEYEDVLQEFKIKIYTSIVSYSKKWEEYRKTGKCKPIPIEFYLKTAMINKTKDFIKMLNMDSIENVEKISVDNVDFDYSEFSDISSEINLESNECKINGVDLFIGLIGRKKSIFSMYLQGYSMEEIAKEYPSIDAQNTIDKQINFLYSKKSVLENFSVQVFSSMVFDEN